MTIEWAQKAHIPALADIEKECFAAPWSKNALSSALGTGIFLVAAERDIIVGYIGCQVVLDEGYITNVAVSAKHRRKGIADALIHRLIAQAKEQKLAFVTLEVRQSNEAAIRLYQKHGFESVGIRKSFYRKPIEDAVLMTYYI